MVMLQACPDCQAYYASIGRTGGPCRPGCPTRSEQERPAEIAQILAAPLIQCIESGDNNDDAWAAVDKVFGHKT